MSIYFLFLGEWIYCLQMLFHFIEYREDLWNGKAFSAILGKFLNIKIKESLKISLQTLKNSIAFHKIACNLKSFKGVL